MNNGKEEILKECVQCKLLFKPYLIDVQCMNCDEGTEELEMDFSEDMVYRECRVCKGHGDYSQMETYFCCEDCLEDYKLDQLT